jgi:HEAT repeat protein
VDSGTVRFSFAARPGACGDGDVSGDPLLPATLADSITIWPSLLRLARTPSVPQETRRTAVFWLGEAAGTAAARTLDSIATDSAGDREVRKQAVFALSQRSGNEGVPALLRIARTNPDPELRKSALFWLGQSEDPRALALFEEILR